MTNPTEIEPVCDFCDKRGLAVLPVRYAMSPATAKTPKTRALDADGATALPELGDTAHYTRRLLRPGYLYVYDEARARWEGYFVTIYGHLMAFQVGKPVPDSYKLDALPCTRSGHFEIAGMVTVSDPDNATNVWFGFSDVEWTKDVLDKHADAAYRKKHMQVLNVPTALASGKQPNVHPMKTELGTKVAEYALNIPAAKYDFNVSPFRFSARREHLNSTLEKSKKLHKSGGVIISLHDPVGVATEVAAHMNKMLENHLQLAKADEVNVRKIAVASVMGELRAAVRSNAESERLDEATTAPAYATAAAGPGLIFDPKLQKQIQASGQVSAEQLKAAQDEAWRKYTHQENGKPRFDEAGSDAFYKTYNEQLKAFTDSKINPLGKVHVAWATSAHMQYYLECNFDASNIQSGLAYLEVVIKFTEGTQGIRPCFNQYEKWADAGKFDPANALLRALVLNQDKLANTVTQATAFDPKAIPWDNFVDTFKDSLEGVAKAHGDRLTTLLGNMSGPLAKAMGAVLDGVARPAITAMGMIHGGGWKLVKLQSSRKEMRQFIARMMIEMSIPNLNEAQLKQAVAREIKLAGIRGEKMEGRAGTSWLVWLDPQAATQGRVALRTPQTHIKELGDIRYQSFKKVISLEVRAGVCVGIVQAWCLTKTLADYGKALEGDKSEAGWRLFAGSMAVSGTLIESVGVALKNTTPPVLPGARGLTGRFALGFGMEVAGKAFGLAGGVIMATWDAMKAQEEFAKDNRTTAWLYVGSSVLGMAVAIMFTFGYFTWVTVLVVAAFLVVAYFLDKAKSNAIQSWLENSIFGCNNSYKSGDLEMKEYKLAIS